MKYFARCGTMSTDSLVVSTFSNILLFILGVLFECDFEYDVHPMCGLIQSNQDHFDWIKHYGSTESRGTGPDGDHTSGNGKKVLVVYILSRKYVCVTKEIMCAVIGFPTLLSPFSNRIQKRKK